MCVGMDGWMDECVKVFLYVCMYGLIYAFMYICLYVRMLACMHVLMEVFTDEWKNG